MRRGTYIDDPLFPDAAMGGDPNQHPGGGPPPKSPKGANGGDPNPEVGLTMQGAAELILQAQAPLLSKIEELSETTAKLTSHISSQRPSAPPSKDSEPEEDFLSQLTSEPEKAIRNLMRSELSNLAPLIGNLMNSGASAFIGLEAQQIDAEFGAGAWSKLFDKPMQTIIDSYRQNNVGALADRNTITREVNGLKGQLINELVDFRNKAKQMTAEEKEAQRKELADSVANDVVQRTNMTGGIRRHATEGLEVTESVKGYVAERQRAIGGNEDPKSFLERTDYGNTYEDYLNHQKKLKESGRAQ